MEQILGGGTVVRSQPPRLFGVEEPMRVLQLKQICQGFDSSFQIYIVEASS